MTAIIKRRLLSLGSPNSVVASFLGKLLTTRGDMPLCGASVVARLAVGAANTFLGSDGTDLSYRTASQTLTSLGIVVGTWTPTFAYETPGTSSIAYTTQEGNYLQVGTLWLVWANLVFTPTEGTAAGDCRFTGLPATVGSQIGPGWVADLTANWTWPAARTAVGMRFEASGAYARMFAQGTLANGASFTVASTADGASHTIRYGGVFVT